MVVKYEIHSQTFLAEQKNNFLQQQQGKCMVHVLHSALKKGKMNVVINIHCTRKKNKRILKMEGKWIPNLGY